MQLHFYLIIVCNFVRSLLLSHSAAELTDIRFTPSSAASSGFFGSASSMSYGDPMMEIPEIFDYDDLLLDKLSAGETEMIVHDSSLFIVVENRYVLLSKSMLYNNSKREGVCLSLVYETCSYYRS